MNQEPQDIKIVFLPPGHFYFGSGSTRIRTLLGSCVSITLWHPGLHIGGMCHYLLPTRSGHVRAGLDGRYGDEAIALFLQELKRSATQPPEYQVKLFGGGNMFPGVQGARGSEIGTRNIEIGRELLKKHGFRIVREHLAGAGHRNLAFDLWSGNVWVRYRQNVTRVPSAE